MRKVRGERKAESLERQKGPNSGSSNDLSSSELDATDKRMLTLAGNRPVTILSMAEGTDISFVECIRRTRRLQEIGLLERTKDVADGGLYRYLFRKRLL